MIVSPNHIDVSEEMKNPFPGLRPFEIGESHLFFGRDGHSEEVLTKLLRNNFIAILGSSGTGKSSLMNCGIIPKLYSGLYSKNGNDWEVVYTRPGSNPIKNLAKSILTLSDNDADREELLLNRLLAATTLRSSSLGLVDLIKQYQGFSNKNILLFVDQFEELFRFKADNQLGDSDETTAFVNLLLEAVRQSEVPIYIALTIRSDYSGSFAQYPKLTKAINLSHYLVPHMTRDQRRQAIEGPIAVAGGKISTRLVQQLLNDVGDNNDQLPLIQHALMRSWRYWLQNKTTDEPIDIKHYTAIGTIKKALSQHANEIFDGLSISQQQTCEVLFKTITEKGNAEFGVRKPTKLNIIAAIAAIEEEELKSVVEAFRKHENSLLMPPSGVTLNSNTTIDISHESLIRIWNKLHKWVEEEDQAIEMYMQLSDASEKYQQGLTTLWRPPDLQLALNWLQDKKPTLEWAQRYDPAYERAMVFLKSSKEVYEIEQKNKERNQLKKLQRNKLLSMIFGIIAIFSILLMIYGFSQQLEAERQQLAAEENSKEAILQKENAQKSEEAALVSERKAKKDRESAIISREEAMQAKGDAEFNRENAELSAEIALENSIEANRQAEIARDKTKEANEQTERARTEQIKANNFAQEADRLRYLAIARSLAVKSLTVNDKDMKGLLALQAYQFNERFEGDHSDHDIYNGLYNGYKRLLGDSVNRLFGHAGSVRSMIFSTDGKTLYTTSGDGKIIKRNMENDQYKVIADYGKDDNSNRKLIISPDNKWLVSSNEASHIAVFNLKKQKLGSKKIEFLNTRMLDMAYLNDNSGFVSVGEDSTLYFCDLKEVKKIFKVDALVNGMTVSDDSRYVALVLENGKLVIADRNKGYRKTIYTLGQNNPLVSVAFSHSGKFLALGQEKGSVKIWDIDKKRVKANLSGFSAQVSAISFSPDDSKLAAVSFNREGRLWFTDSFSKQPIVFSDHDDWVWSLAFSPDGSKLLTGSMSGLIRIYPTDLNDFIDTFCDNLSRNMSYSEWNQFVDIDISYEYSCPNLPIGKENIEEE